MSAADHKVVHAGMYVPSDTHKAAWQAWFSALTEVYLSRHYGPVELGFSENEQAYTAVNVIAAQTCGYPFVTRWADTHETIAVPLFDVPGCIPDTGQYSSWFITRADHTATSLRQFANSRVALNSERSNSGMNVLRYAISRLTSTDTFFSERVLTGAHKQSMHAVAEGHADLAAIDVVTYALMKELDPALYQKLKIVGQSGFTTGLPFICAKYSNINRNDLGNAMNQAVEHMDPEARKLLHLSGFAPIAAKNYTKIKKLEDAAIAAGYPELK